MSNIFNTLNTILSAKLPAFNYKAITRNELDALKFFLYRLFKNKDQKIDETKTTVDPDFKKVYYVLRKATGSELCKECGQPIPQNTSISAIYEDTSRKNICTECFAKWIHSRPDSLYICESCGDIISTSNNSYPYPMHLNIQFRDDLGIVTSMNKLDPILRNLGIELVSNENIKNLQYNDGKLYIDRKNSKNSKFRNTLEKAFKMAGKEFCDFVIKNYGKIVCHNCILENIKDFNYFFRNFWIPVENSNIRYVLRFTNVTTNTSFHTQNFGKIKRKFLANGQIYKRILNSVDLDDILFGTSGFSINEGYEERDTGDLSTPIQSLDSELNDNYEFSIVRNFIYAISKILGKPEDFNKITFEVNDGKILIDHVVNDDRHVDLGISIFLENPINPKDQQRIKKEIESKIIQRFSYEFNREGKFSRGFVYARKPELLKGVKLESLDDAEANFVGLWYQQALVEPKNITIEFEENSVSIYITLEVTTKDFERNPGGYNYEF